MVSISTLKDWTPQQIQAGREASPALDAEVRWLDQHWLAAGCHEMDHASLNNQ